MFLRQVFSLKGFGEFLDTIGLTSLLNRCDQIPLAV
jgi:hypothetical protein